MWILGILPTSESSEGKKEHITGNWKKGDLARIVTASLVKVFPAVTGNPKLKKINLIKGGLVA